MKILIGQLLAGSLGCLIVACSTTNTTKTDAVSSASAQKIRKLSSKSEAGGGSDLIALELHEVLQIPAQEEVVVSSDPVAREILHYAVRGYESMKDDEQVFSADISNQLGSAIIAAVLKKSYTPIQPKSPIIQNGVEKEVTFEKRAGVIYFDSQRFLANSDDLKMKISTHIFLEKAGVDDSAYHYSSQIVLK